MEIEEGVYDFRIRYTRSDGEIVVEYTRKLVDNKEHLDKIRNELEEHLAVQCNGYKDLEIRWSRLKPEKGWW